MVYPNNINLNLNTQYVLPIPTAQQGDTARVLTFNILDNGVPFSLEGKTVRARIVKPDETKVYNDLTITNATNGKCTLKLTNQVLALAGKVNCQLEIKEGEELLSTIIFSIDVEPSIDITGAVESSNEFTALQNGLTKLDEWDKYFKETSGAFEEKYTERLNGIDASLEELMNFNYLSKTLTKMNNKESVLGICVGDSITFGAKQSPSTDPVDTCRYPDKLQEYLKTIYNNENIIIENKGYCGWATTTWIENNFYNYKSKVINSNPDFIILMLGINDMHIGLTVEEYLNNISSMIDYTSSFGIEMIIISPPVTLEKNESFSGYKGTNETMKQLSDSLKEICSAKNVVYINLFNEMSDIFYKYNTYRPCDIIGRDCIHWIEYSLIAKIIIKNILGSTALTIDDYNYRKIPVVGSPYIETNIKSSKSTNGFRDFSEFGDVYWGDSFVKGSGYYLKLKLNVLVKNMRLKIHYPINKNNGILTIKDNGVECANIDLNCRQSDYGRNAVGVCSTVIEDLDIGYHEILIHSDNIAKGESPLENPTFALEGFTIEKNNNMYKKDDIFFTSSETNKTKILDGSITINNGVIIIDGKFDPSTGIDLFTKLESKTSKIKNYKLDFTENKIELNVYKYSSTISQNTALGTSTIDLSKNHNIMLKITDSSIKCFVDGIEEFNYTREDSGVELSGYFNLWCLNSNSDIYIKNISVISQ